jgi:hypothetical protein
MSAHTDGQSPEPRRARKTRLNPAPQVETDAKETPVNGENEGEIRTAPDHEVDEAGAETAEAGAEAAEAADDAEGAAGFSDTAEAAGATDGSDADTADDADDAGDAADADDDAFAGSGGAQANGEDEDNPFGDVEDSDAWRADLPTEETAKADPLSVFSKSPIRALGRLYAEDVGACLGLIRKLVAAAGEAAVKSPEVTGPKLRDLAAKEAADWRREQKQAEQEEDEADDKLSVQLLDWLEAKVIAAYFVDEYRRAFIDYRDPGTSHFLCRPARHDDIEDLIVTCPLVKIAPPDAVVKAVVRTVEARCRRSPLVRKVFVRRGWHERKLYIDRAAPDASVIVVDATGFQVIPLDQSPVRFQHDVAMAELPIPVPGGSIELLWKYVRVLRPQDRHLVSGFTIGCFAPNGPYSGLGVFGQYGASKTLMMFFLSQLIDPSKVSPGRMSESEQNTVIHAQRAWLLPYDNHIGLGDEQSNTMCRLVQGGGFRTRMLYSDNKEVVFDVERPIIINGITQIITRPDLADRFTTVTLERIPPLEMKARQALREAFEKDRPALLGAILAAISGGLARTDFMPPNRLPRIADHTLWVSRCERGLGMKDGDYIRAVNASARTGARDVVDSDYLSAAVVQMQDARGGTKWQDTPTNTLTELNRHTFEKAKKSKEWPANGNWLGRRLHGLVPALDALGITVVPDGWSWVEVKEPGSLKPVMRSVRTITIEGKAAAQDTAAGGTTNARGRDKPRSGAGKARRAAQSRKTRRREGFSTTSTTSQDTQKGGDVVERSGPKVREEF